jgi:hypothetical protein
MLTGGSGGKARCESLQIFFPTLLKGKDFKTRKLVEIVMGQWKKEQLFSDKNFNSNTSFNL